MGLCFRKTAAVLTTRKDQSYTFYQKWKVNLEYRILENKTFEDKKQGYLTELLIPVKEVLYFGLGYNFTSFDDDLSNEDDYDVKGFFVRITGVY